MDISAINSYLIDQFRASAAQNEADQQKAADELKKALVDDNQ